MTESCEFLHFSAMQEQQSVCREQLFEALIVKIAKYFVVDRNCDETMVLQNYFLLTEVALKNTGTKGN